MAKYIKTEEGYKLINDIGLAPSDELVDISDRANNAYNLANQAQTTANTVQNTVSNKMDKTNPVGTGSFSMNRKAGTTIGNYSTAIGRNGTASGSYSYAEGDNTTATESGSHAEGGRSMASGGYSHAEGEYTSAAGYATHAEGQYTKAEGNVSHAEGRLTRSTSIYSHAEGHMTNSAGKASHAEGNETSAYGQASHSEGIRTITTGDYSHAEGSQTVAVGVCAHIEGSGGLVYIEVTGAKNSTVYTIDRYAAVRPYLYVGAVITYKRTHDSIGFTQSAQIVTIDDSTGSITMNRSLCDLYSLDNSTVALYTSGIAFGDYSHVEGLGTLSIGLAQHVQGEFNIQDSDGDLTEGSKRGKYAHIVGNGMDNNNRSNAHTLDWSGNAWYQGDVYVGGTSQDNGEVLAKISEIIPAPTTATVGQTIVVKSVDDNGKPTEWEAVDMASGSSEWELLTEIELAENGAIARTEYDAKYTSMFARLTLPKVETTISTTNAFSLLHMYGLYYMTIGNTSCSSVAELRCEKIGNELYETFCYRPQSGVGMYSNLQTRNSTIVPPTNFYCGGSLELPAGTKLIVYGKE